MNNTFLQQELPIFKDKLVTAIYTNSFNPTSSLSIIYQNENNFVSLQGQTLIDLIGFPFDDYGIESYHVFFNRSISAVAKYSRFC